MIVSDLDYLDHLENVDPATITGGLGIGVAFFTLVEQSAQAYLGVISNDGDAKAEAIAINKSTIAFNGVPVFP